MRVGTEVLVAKRRRKEEYARDDRSPAQLESESQKQNKRNTTFIFYLCEGINEGMHATHGLLFQEDVCVVHYQWWFFTSNKQGPLEMCFCLICCIFCLEITSVLMINGLGPSLSMPFIAQKGTGSSFASWPGISLCGIQLCDASQPVSWWRGLRTLF